MKSYTTIRGSFSAYKSTQPILKPVRQIARASSSLVTPASLADLKPLKKLGNNYKNVGVISYCGKQQGSGVYLHDGIVLTAAHVVPVRFNLADFQFSSDGKEWSSIKRIIRHPLYSYFNPEQLFAYDLAVMQLEKEPKENLDKLKINPSKYETIDGVGVGYPVYYAPRNETKSTSTIQTPFIRLGVKASCFWSSQVPNTLEHKIGFMAKMDKGKLKHVKQNYNILDSGINLGMSGGGLFNKHTPKTLAGIVVASPNSAFSAEIEAPNIYVPLRDKISWLRDCKSTLKSNASDLEEIAVSIEKLLGISCCDFLTRNEYTLTFRLPLQCYSPKKDIIKKMHIDKLSAAGFSVVVIEDKPDIFKRIRLAIAGENLTQIKAKLNSALYFENMKTVSTP